MKLENFVTLRKSLVNSKVEDSHILGSIEHLSAEICEVIKNLEECIIELKDENGVINPCSKINDLIGKTITLEIAQGEFPQYFENFSKLIERHAYSFDLLDFYVHEGDITPANSEHPLMLAYRNILHLIDFLKKKSDYISETGGELTLYFHKIGKSLILPIHYYSEDLKKSRVSQIENFCSSFDEGLHKDDRRNLFKHDLIDFYSKKEKYFSLMLKEWDILRDNYLHSFDSYLEGFSFEKIKTSSLSYFQEMSDKIHETIRKISNYLFAIPIAFLFLASRLEFKEPSLLKNLGLLALGYLFFILIWWVFFKNIKESLDAVEKEIVRYEEKIKNVPDLEEIKSELDKLKDKTLKSQYDKLLLLKIVSITIILVLSSIVLLIHEKEVVSIAESVSHYFITYQTSDLN